MVGNRGKRLTCDITGELLLGRKGSSGEATLADSQGEVRVPVLP
jgi:hypothetical protein